MFRKIEHRLISKPSTGVYNYNWAPAEQIETGFSITIALNELRIRLADNNFCSLYCNRRLGLSDSLTYTSKF